MGVWVFVGRYFRVLNVAVWQNLCFGWRFFVIDICEPLGCKDSCFFMLFVHLALIKMRCVIKIA